MKYIYIYIFYNGKEKLYRRESTLPDVDAGLSKRSVAQKNKLKFK